MAYKAVFGLRGINGKVAKITYNLVATNAIDALDALGFLSTVLTDISDATLAYETLVNEVSESDAVGNGDIFEVASIVCPTEGGTKTATINVPAPKIGIFLAATGALRDQVDISDAALVDFVDQLASSVTVSDGDTLDGGSPLRGRRITRKLAAPSL